MNAKVFPVSPSRKSSAAWRQDVAEVSAINLLSIDYDNGSYRFGLDAVPPLAGVFGVNVAEPSEDTALADISAAILE